MIKPTRGCRLVQDLRLVNEAVVPLHPIVANPYTFLSQVPDDAQWYSVLQWKHPFCIPLHPLSICLFLSGLIQRR